MTIRFLTEYGAYKQGSIVSLSSAEETAFVNAKLATTDLNGGLPYIAPKSSSELAAIQAEKLNVNDLNVDVLPITTAGSYSGNGTSQTISLGFKPDFVVVKAATTQYACWANRFNFYRRNDHFLNIASFGGQFGVQINDNGFTIGNDNRVNASATTYYYFAYCDNGSNNLLQANWQGNGVAGRTVDYFTGTPLAGALIKRDSPQGMVYGVADVANYFFNGTGSVVSTGTTINGSTGEIVLGSGNEVNQWSGILGEGVNCLAFPKNSKSVHVLTYTGTGANQRITLPFAPEFFIIAPRNTASATTRCWFSSLPAGNHLPLTNQGIGSGEFTVVRNSILFTSTTGNLAGQDYVIYAFRRIRNQAYLLPNIQNLKYKKSVEIASGGYIDCGTSDTLAVTGDLTMEWFGTVLTPDDVQYTASATLDTDVGNQDKLNPLIFRSNGADGTTNAVNYGMAIVAPHVSTDTDLVGCSILVCTHDRWQLLNNIANNLDNHPMNTGFVVDPHDLVHIVATHSGAGVWKVYVNGVQVKERKRDMVAAVGRPNVQGFSGMSTVIGARKRVTIDNANGGSFRMARIYNKALAPSEVKNNYLSLFDLATATAGFVEEWDVTNAFATTLTATVNTANNGLMTGTTITN